MWSYAYATFTNQEFNKSLFSDDDEFGRMLNECRQSGIFQFTKYILAIMIHEILVDITYPDLAKPRAPEPPWPSSTGEGQQPYNNDVKWRQIPIVQTNTPSQPLNSGNNVVSNNIPAPISNLQNHPPLPLSPQPPSVQRSETSFSVTPDAPPVSRPPSFDRSQKPTAAPRAQPPNSQNTLPPSIKSVPKSLPAVGTLGGARVADPAQIPSKQSQYTYVNFLISIIGFSLSRVLRFFFEKFFFSFPII